MPDPAARPAFMVTPALLIAVLGCREGTSPLTDPTTGPPVQAAVIQPLLFRQVTTGQDHSCGVTRDNVAYCWGDNGSGQLGVGTSSGPESCVFPPRCFCSWAAWTRR